VRPRKGKQLGKQEVGRESLENPVHGVSTKKIIWATQKGHVAKNIRAVGLLAISGGENRKRAKKRTGPGAFTQAPQAHKRLLEALRKRWTDLRGEEENTLWAGYDPICRGQIEEPYKAGKATLKAQVGLRVRSKDS